MTQDASNAATRPATTLCTLHLDENTNVVKWCPATSGLGGRLAVGTYQLNPDSGHRSGHIHMYDLADERHDTAPALVHKASAALPGVFEATWRPGEGQPLLAVALTDGGTALLDPETAVLARSPGPDDGVLACCVDWQRAAGDDQLLTSFSDGAAARLQATPPGLRELSRWQAHDLEAWAVAADLDNASLAFTGGDDGVLCGWDSRTQGSVWRERRAHGAGVCCVAPSPHTAHLVATGSYDEAARAWDLRWPGRPLMHSKIATGGGVWRLQWHPQTGDTLLAACMQFGFLVLRLDASTGHDWTAIEHYEHQRTLAYGADWRKDQPDVVATASFYDNLVHVWRPDSVAQS